MATRTLTPKQNVRVRAILRALVNQRFDGKVTHAAKELGVTHPTVINFLNGKQAAGLALLTGIASVGGLTMTQLVGPPEEPNGEALAEPEPTKIAYVLRERLVEIFKAGSYPLEAFDTARSMLEELVAADADGDLEHPEFCDATLRMMLETGSSKPSFARMLFKLYYEAWLGPRKPGWSVNRP